MGKNNKNRKPLNGGLAKCPTGIQGLDEITNGGLPQGRPTLVCGSAGCGKTLMAMEFLVRGATQYDEPGLFMAFEETPEELTQNVASLGFDLTELVEKKKLALDYIHIDKSEIEETGEYDLEGLFIRLGYAIDLIGAKRVVLDTIEALFGGFSNTSILRAELRRLFRWLKDRGVTAIITGERGEGTLTRQGLEEYVSDCVILLDHRINNQISTRRLRIVKYRGSTHGADEFPFLITDRGISVLPITSLALDHSISNERISTGIPRLDSMLGGKGYYRGSSILVSGTAGTGKTSMSAHFVDSACRRGERALYFAFEEPPSQIIRNMRSIGINLEQWVRKGLLRFHAVRPTLYGLEMHLVAMHNITEEFKPSVVAVDPVTNLLSIGTETETKSMLMRLIDFFKMNYTTALLTSLTSGEADEESTEVGISSLVDTWLLLRDIESNGERNRGMYILKSRGMEHSNQIREFRLTDNGIELVNVYVGHGNVLMGTSRLTQEMEEKSEMLMREQEIERKKHGLERKRKILEAQIAALRLEFEAEEEEIKRVIAQEEQQKKVLQESETEIIQSRQGGSQAISPEVRRQKRAGRN